MCKKFLILRFFKYACNFNFIIINIIIIVIYIIFLFLLLGSQFVFHSSSLFVKLAPPACPAKTDMPRSPSALEVWVGRQHQSDFWIFYFLLPGVELSIGSPNCKVAIH